jgi:hypothetical protein
MQFKSHWDRANQTVHNHLRDVVSEALSIFSDRKTDAMHSIQTDADGIMYTVGRDARTCIGGMVFYHLAHDVVVCLDTFCGDIAARWEDDSFSAEWHEDPAGFQNAVSDLYWATRS